MPVKFLSTFCLLFVMTSLQAQVFEYSRENYKTIKSISPSDTDYTDLEVIGNAIGDARVVMLGEQDHGDAPTFLAKTRLIKYLHERKGFNVLAFEGDFFALNVGWDNVRKASPFVDTFLRHNVYPLWTMCDACSELFYHYIPATQQTPYPIHVTGVDNQITGQYTLTNIYGYVDSLLSSSNYFSGISDISKQAYLDTIQRLTKDFWRNDSTFSNTYSYLSNFYDSLLLVSRLGEYSFEQRLLRSLKADALQMDIYHKKENKRNFVGFRVRDKAMADNLKWLVLNKFSSEKIIVWAANAHIMKNSPGALRTEPWPGNDRPWWYESMATFFCDEYELANITYVLGFVSREGVAGRLKKGDSVGYKIIPPRDGSLENIFPEDLPYGFIDFIPFNAGIKESDHFYMKGHGHVSKSAKWNKVFDGVFYIKTIYRCERNAF